MTGLLVGTFVLAGLHTLLWLPRSLQWRRELKRRSQDKSSGNDINESAEDTKSDGN